jgi:hypothetical protein
LVNDDIICSSIPTYGTNEEAKARADITKAGGVPKAAPGGHLESMTEMPEMPMSAGGHGHAGGKHIVAMSVCGQSMAGFNGSPASPLKINKLVKGQKWTLSAYYDYQKAAGMKNNFGGMDNVMGISIMYIKTTPKIRSG